MKPKEYVRKYNLGKTKHFPHNEFIADLTHDFVATIEYLQAVQQLNYERYKVCIREIKSKFDGISNKSIAELKVFDKLWNYFFATVIAPMRQQIFGEYLEKKRKAHEERQKQWEYIHGSDDDFSSFSFFHAIFKHLYNQLAIPTQEFRILGLDQNCGESDVKNMYRKLAVEHHPDKGGRPEKFMEITQAKNKCLAYLKTCTK